MSQTRRLAAILARGCGGIFAADGADEDSALLVFASVQIYPENIGNNPAQQSISVCNRPQLSCIIRVKSMGRVVGKDSRADEGWRAKN